MKTNIVKAMVVFAGVAVLSSQASLVGSLHINTNQDTNDTLSVSGFTTRTSNGNQNTRGTVQGDFSMIGGTALGAGDYTGMDVKTFSGTTILNDFNRYGSSGAGGIAAWDFDLSGITTNGWELKIDYTSRRSDSEASGWYLSYTGASTTLDTVDVTTLSPGGGGAWVADPSKYIKLGELAANSVSGVMTFDITSYVEEAQLSDGKVRLIYNDHSFLNDITFNNDSGIQAVPEPATIGLIGLFGGGILFIRRRFMM